MTYQQHTPTTEQVRLAHAESVTFHVMEEPELTEANNMFDRWLAERDQAIEAAAAQRGAERELLAASNTIRGNESICPNCAIIAADHLLDRAEDLEVVDGES